jgi:acetyl-CoA carboxylase carboxyltransferase component
MCPKLYWPDRIVAWPTAEIAVMGAEGAVAIANRQELADADNPDDLRRRLIERYRAEVGPYNAASWDDVDDVIDPAETREVICTTLRRGEGKERHRHPRKHGVMPV